MANGHIFKSQTAESFIIKYATDMATHSKFRQLKINACDMSILWSSKLNLLLYCV